MLKNNAKFAAYMPREVIDDPHAFVHSHDAKGQPPLSGSNPPTP